MTLYSSELNWKPRNRVPIEYKMPSDVAIGWLCSFSSSVPRSWNTELEKLHSQPIATSLGILYSIGTRFLGFQFNSDEYKVMGLAPYGDPRSSARSSASSPASTPIAARIWPKGHA